MATMKQIEANRQNALKSTGPKSVEGKAVSRLNAVTHSLSAVLPEAMTGLVTGVDENKAKWRKELNPQGEQQEWLFDMVVIEAIRIRRCQESFLNLCNLHGQRAVESWDADRRQDAEALAVGLAKNPALVASKLASTPHGCELMITRWTGLRSSLDRHQTWTDNQRSHALDLLGIHPDFRDAETPIDRADGDELAVRHAVIETEITRLCELRESTRSHDASERSMAERTLCAEFTKPVQQIDRYERNAIRRQQWAWRKLNEAKKGETVKPAPPKQLKLHWLRCHKC